MKVIFEASLSEPPSSISCFRDVTLYASCFAKVSVLVECYPDQKDIYYYWLKRNGAYDFVDAIINLDEEVGYKIGIENCNFNIDRIDCHNLNSIINVIRKINNRSN